MRTRFRSRRFLAIGSALLFVASPSVSAGDAFLRIAGQRVAIEDRQQFGDWIAGVERVAAEHPQAYTTAPGTSARDHAMGLPTGKRMHKPLVITKETSGPG